jgi:integrase/recombinase XerD
VTIAAAVDSYLRHVSIERGLSANTVSAYRRDLGVYATWLAGQGTDDPAAITSAEVSAFARHLGTREETPLTASSMARMLSTVRGFHRFMLE